MSATARRLRCDDTAIAVMCSDSPRSEAVICCAVADAFGKLGGCEIVRVRHPPLVLLRQLDVSLGTIAVPLPVVASKSRLLESVMTFTPTDQERDEECVKGIS